MMNKVILWCLGCFMMTQALAASELYEMVSQFEADRHALSRKYPLKESVEYYERFDTFYAGWLKNLSDVAFTSLTQEGKVDYLLLKQEIEKSRYFLSRDRQAYDAVKSVADFAEPLYTFIVQRRRGAVPDAPVVAQTFVTMTEAITAKQLALKEHPYSSWQQAEKASRVVASLEDNLAEAFSFYDGYDPEFTWWVAKSYHALSEQLGGYKDFLKEHFVNTEVKDDGSGIIGQPIGREAVIQSLRFEFIPYDPEDLIKLAEDQFAWCEREMLKASAEMGFGKDWKAALEKVKDTYVPPGLQPALIDSLAEEATRYVEQHDLVTVPPLAKETWRMIMMTPERQKVNPFFTGGEVISISYPTHTMGFGNKMMSMRGNNPHFSRATVHHELIPGHHLQMFMNDRYMPYRKAFRTPFWIEGWALYWEISLWDRGFPKTPEDRIGMLFWRMHRCARIIFSLSYHLEKMTPQQCIDFLVDKVGHEYANAEAEVRRSFVGGYDPLYQIAYMIGGLQFYALHKALVDTGKMTDKQFHDKILQEGPIPVAMVKALLTDEPLKENYHANWKFSKEISFK